MTDDSDSEMIPGGWGVYDHLDAEERERLFRFCKVVPIRPHVRAGQGHGDVAPSLRADPPSDVHDVMSQP